MIARYIAVAAATAVVLLMVWAGLSRDEGKTGGAPAKEVKPAIGRLSEKSSLGELLAALKNPDYGILAAVLISWREPKVVLPPLFSALKDDDAQMRRHSAMALGLLRDKSAVPALIEAMKDKNSDVRYRVIEALGYLGDASAIPAVSEALNDGESRLRQKAVEALDKLAYHSNGKPPVVEEIKDWSAPPATRELGVDTPIAELLEALKDPHSGQEAAVLLGKRSAGEILPRLLSALKDDDAQMRRHSAMALGILGDKSATPALMEAMKDKDIEARISAVKAIGDLRDESALQAVLEAMKDPDYRVRESAVEAFGKLVYPSGGKEQVRGGEAAVSGQEWPKTDGPGPRSAVPDGSGEAVVEGLKPLEKQAGAE